MYSYGLAKFLQKHKIKSNECINAFLESEGIKSFNAKNHYKVSNYIQKNWGKFAQFVHDNNYKNNIKPQKKLNDNNELIF